MIHDLDRAMRLRGIDGIVGYGETTLADPDLTYVVGGTLPRGGFYFKKVGRSPLLIVSNIDRGSAQKYGRVRRIETLTKWGYETLVRKCRNRSEVNGRLIVSVLRKEGVTGKVVLFGRNDLAKGVQLAQYIRRLGVDVLGERPPTVLEVARDTKDRYELDSIRAVGEKTVKVVANVIRMLRNAKLKRGHLEIRSQRATIGLVKSIIASKLAEQGLVAPEGTIFAQGADGADPHNPGTPSQEVKRGRLIVFDIFPQSGNGYWFDLTRTFVIGRAERKARKMFETVQESQNDALDYLREGKTGDATMRRVCNVIERAGFRTVRVVFEGKAKTISSGFIHSLGHGVGLTIGESPYLSFNSKDLLKTNEVVTVEPGLYLPNYGGVRVEDTVVVKSKGIENLANVEKELELA